MQPNKLVVTYSGGMIRRLEIAQSMLHRPRVLFLDEPTLPGSGRARSCLGACQAIADPVWDDDRADFSCDASLLPNGSVTSRLEPGAVFARLTASRRSVRPRR